MKVLIADDEQRIIKIVTDFLNKSKIDVVSFVDGESAWECFSKNPEEFDLLILDIMMPGYNGWELCRMVRNISNIPVIMLTARSDEFDELMAYENGADEYVTKPFRPTVLVKRVEALIRRYKDEKKDYSEYELDDVLQFNHEAHEVRINGEEVLLTLKEYKILNMLISNSGLVLSRDQILMNVWGDLYEGEIRTVDSHVARLRVKLGKWGEKHLKTVYGVGYKIEGMK